MNSPGMALAELKAAVERELSLCQTCGGDGSFIYSGHRIACHRCTRLRAALARADGGTLAEPMTVSERKDGGA